MQKRLFDVVFSSVVLLVSAPLLGLILCLVWLQDRHSPLYRASRVGRYNRDFVMIKVRSMVVDADKTGVASTSTTDKRVTRLGRFIRRFKIDELPQFWNVWKGEMSVVGPRPNTRHWGVDLYTPEEMHILDVRPGITDLSSIVFSDEGEILRNAEAPDVLYNQLIRPWKSRLCLVYKENASVFLDVAIVGLTFAAIISKPLAIYGVVGVLKVLGAPDDLVEVCRRRKPLVAVPPPGGDCHLQVSIGELVGFYGLRALHCSRDNRSFEPRCPNFTEGMS